MNLQEIINVYITVCTEQKTLSLKTTKAYQTDLRQFADYTNSIFDREHIQSYITQLHKISKP